eukprot:scaffold49615_cov45-Attheya_sp.AAC.2
MLSPTRTVSALDDAAAAADVVVCFSSCALAARAANCISSSSCISSTKACFKVRILLVWVHCGSILKFGVAPTIEALEGCALGRKL